jgi:hypothetical protein
MPKRTLSEAHKKIVAANNGWKCNACGCVLPPSFQIDHVVPLWQGGADTIENSQSLCGTCHANKTQRESIERSRLAREARVALALQRQAEYEAAVRVGEVAPAPRKRKEPAPEVDMTHDNPFIRFMYIKPV